MMAKKFALSFLACLIFLAAAFPVLAQDDFPVVTSMKERKAAVDRKSMTVISFPKFHVF